MLIVNIWAGSTELLNRYPCKQILPFIIISEGTRGSISLKTE